MALKDELGRSGEEHAAQYLAAAGYRILQRNWRCPQGEIDIVAERDGEVVFIEVKTRSGVGYGHPFESITPIKLARLRRLAAIWCTESGDDHRRIRIDAIAVVARPGFAPELEHLERVF